ncbi:MAG: 30S ribosome-binding factor RbfA [Synergistaceae bacterium]|nr:30S ribosome-binding factor RbfA [Synergistaceae bacterium]
MVTYRIPRINKEFLRLISDMLQTRIKNDKVRDAILTKVNVSRDLGFAKVFYTLIDVSSKDDVQVALDMAAAPLRAYLGKEMHLRTIPELHFVYDDSEAKAREMDELLDRIAAMDSTKESVQEKE